MCSFGSCKTRFEFLSQFRKVRNVFECFVTQVQTHLPKTKRVWPMKINVICTVLCARFFSETTQPMSETVVPFNRRNNADVHYALHYGPKLLHLCWKWWCHSTVE